VSRGVDRAGGQNGVLAKVADYYSSKIREFGPTPKGVDWNSAQSQSVRFAQLAFLFRGRSAFSLNDIGCGYGAFLDYLTPDYPEADYRGFDVSAAMVEQARALHPQVGSARFAVGTQPSARADFSVASGILNVRLDIDERTWLAYVEDTLDTMDRYSMHGFAFNCLTSHSDPERRRADLFYANPAELFDHCCRRYSRQVALLQDYGLYEFTMIVRKS